MTHILELFLNSLKKEPTFRQPLADHMKKNVVKIVSVLKYFNSLSWWLLFLLLAQIQSR